MLNQVATMNEKTSFTLHPPEFDGTVVTFQKRSCPFQEIGKACIGYQVERNSFLCFFFFFAFFKELVLF